MVLNEAFHIELVGRKIMEEDGEVKHSRWLKNNKEGLSE